MYLDAILSTVYYAIWSLSSIFTLMPMTDHNITTTCTFYTTDANSSTTINNIDELEINPDYELKILMHGWSFYKNYSSDWYNFTVEEYLKKEHVNIIAVESENEARHMNLYSSVKYAVNIGTQTGKLIMNLHKVKGIQFNKIHIIGHLAGAHAAGVAGEHVYQETGKYIDRITGLDPINFGFFKFSSDGRLTKNDAIFVDVIHGDGSFYDNAGRIDFFGYPYTTKCRTQWYQRHTYSPRYFANSINNVDALIGTKCPLSRFNYFHRHCTDNGTAVLGEHVDREAFGKYYLSVEGTNKYICSNTTSVA